MWMIALIMQQLKWVLGAKWSFAVLLDVITRRHHNIAPMEPRSGSAHHHE